MAKFKIWYNIGYGREEEEIEAANEDEASETACENQFAWGADELEEEEAEDKEANDEETSHE